LISLDRFDGAAVRAPDRLDSPVYKPDEEHPTAQVLNAKKRMDPALVNASRVFAASELMVAISLCQIASRYLRRFLCCCGEAAAFPS
jgi:hypothetical protein